MRQFFPEREFRDLGLSSPAIAFLRDLAEYVQTQRDLAAAQAELNTAQQDIINNGNAIDAANDDIGTLNLAVNALDGRIDAYDALAPFVRQDQAARPSHTPFAGITASNPPTQAEVQAVSDAVASQSTTLATLLTTLDTVKLLT